MTVCRTLGVVSMRKRVKARSHSATKDEQPPFARLPLAIVHRRIDELKPDPRNPRRHSRKQIKQLARSIETFGFTVPALVDADSNVIAGHGRILACRELGWREIPTISIDDLNEEKRRGLMIAVNRPAENAEWNERLLAEQLKDLT